MIDKASNKIFSQKYVRNIRKVFLGTAAAHVITLMALPLLTRLYSVEEFGVLGVYIAFANVGRIVFSLRYDLAIQSSEKESDAFSVFWLGVLASIVFALVAMAIIHFFDASYFVGLGELKYLVPWMILVSTFDGMLGIWINRKKQFKIFAYSRVTRALLIVIFQVFFFKLINGGLGLLVGVFVGEILTVVLVLAILQMKNMRLEFVSFKSIYCAALKHKDNPLFLLPGHSLNIGVAQLPILLVSSIYGKEAAGYIYMAQRIVSVPGQLISNAIFKVFFSEATSIYRATGACYTLAISTLRTAAAPLILLFLAIALGSYFLLDVVLGESWTPAKLVILVYAISEIVPALFHSISAIWFVTNSQRLNLKYQVYRACIVGFALFISTFFEELIYFVLLYAVARAFSYLIFLKKCLHLSKGTGLQPVDNN